MRPLIALLLAAGLALAVSSMSWAFASIAAGRLMVRTSYRLVAVIGGLSLVAGGLLLVALEPSRGIVWATAFCTNSTIRSR